ncbi:hypothetical protein OHA72_04820 [Dactylosporangium sp. NBC_01737]|uniref:hypothetical protein n=1 Tax=Dactylosporangium sp. NBC_01737 TaxID=2975959 RepID=UPI002E15A95D|nr:hypothetical protein OHA72_04820 [Dactylosporangium sp. NBC_01737]
MPVLPVAVGPLARALGPVGVTLGDALGDRAALLRDLDGAGAVDGAVAALVGRVDDHGLGGDLHGLGVPQHALWHRGGADRLWPGVLGGGLLRGAGGAFELAAHHVDLVAQRVDGLVQHADALDELTVRGAGRVRDVATDVVAERVELLEHRLFDLAAHVVVVGAQRDGQADEHDDPDGEHRGELQDEPATEQQQQRGQRSKADASPEEDLEHLRARPSSGGFRGWHEQRPYLVFRAREMPALGVEDGHSTTTVRYRRG